MDKLRKSSWESINASMDFVDMIAEEDTISLASVTVYDRLDNSEVPTMLDGSATVNGSKIFQRLTGGESDKTYVAIYRVTTVAGDKLEATLLIEVNDALETYTITETADTYCTLEEAAFILEAELNTAPWDGATDVERTKALKKATRLIDRLEFEGEKSDAAQALEFPRGGDSVVPPDIQIACTLIAVRLLEGVDMNLERESLRHTSTGISAVRMSSDTGIILPWIVAGIPSAEAWDYLRPYLRGPQGIDILRM